MTPKKTTAKNSATVKVHNSVKLDSKNLLPINFSGSSFVSLGGHNYIPFVDADDYLFQTLLTARLLSPTQSSCIGDKTFYTLGEGLTLRDSVFPKEFDRKINGKRQTIDDVLRLAADAFWQDGNAFIEIARAVVAGKKYVHVYIHKNMDCRLEENEDGSDPTHVLRSREFRRNGILTSNDKCVRIPLWTDDAFSDDQVWVKDEGKPNIERTMIHLKNEINALDGYGLPSNFPGLQNAVLEYKAGRFNIDNFDNNMFLGGILMIEGSLSPDEEKKLTREIKKMYTGDGKYNRILPFSSEGSITNSKFIPFNEKHDGHFIELDKRNEEKIIASNNWSKELLDMKNQSGLGKGGDYLKQLFKIKYQTVIKPAQDLFMFNFIEPFLQIVDEWKGTKFSDMDWWLKPLIPISFEGALDINSLLTVDEGREEIGKKALGGEAGKRLISEVKSRSKENTGGAE